MAQLQAYLRSAAVGGAQAAAERKQLGDAVLENPTSAEAWAQFLEHEESFQQGGSQGHGGKGGAGLFHLYHKATELVQHSKARHTEAYTSIWLGYARHQW